MKTFEQKIAEQVNLNKAGIYEVFVNQGELREYWGLAGEKESDMMQKVFAVVFEGEVIHLSFEEKRAIAELLDAAEVDTLEELAD